MSCLFRMSGQGFGASGPRVPRRVQQAPRPRRIPACAASRGRWWYPADQAASCVLPRDTARHAVNLIIHSQVGPGFRTPRRRARGPDRAPMTAFSTTAARSTPPPTKVAALAVSPRTEPDPDRAQHHLDQRQKRQFGRRDDPAAQRVDHHAQGQDHRADQRPTRRCPSRRAPDRLRPGRPAPAPRSEDGEDAAQHGHRQHVARPCPSAARRVKAPKPTADRSAAMLPASAPVSSPSRTIRYMPKTARAMAAQVQGRTRSPRRIQPSTAATKGEAREEEHGIGDGRGLDRIDRPGKGKDQAEAAKRPGNARRCGSRQRAARPRSTR